MPPTAPLSPSRRCFDASAARRCSIFTSRKRRVTSTATARRRRVEDGRRRLIFAGDGGELLDALAHVAAHLRDSAGAGTLITDSTDWPLMSSPRRPRAAPIGRAHATPDC